MGDVVPPSNRSVDPLTGDDPSLEDDLPRLSSEIFLTNVLLSSDARRPMSDKVDIRFFFFSSGVADP